MSIYIFTFIVMPTNEGLPSHKAPKELQTTQYTTAIGKIELHEVLDIFGKVYINLGELSHEDAENTAKIRSNSHDIRSWKEHQRIVAKNEGWKDIQIPWILIRVFGEGYYEFVNYDKNEIHIIKRKNLKFTI